MNRKTLNAFLLAALVITVVSNWVMTPHPERRNFEYFPNMAHSPRYNAFAANPNFLDGKTLRQPEAGTLPRGFHSIRYEATPEDAIRAGEELHDPFSAADASALERGEFVFKTFCQPCHGAMGRGDGIVALRGFPAPPSLLTGKSGQMKDGQLFHILTFGQKNMPSYAAQISPEDRWKAILYVRKLQKEAAPPTPITGAPQLQPSPSHTTPKLKAEVNSSISERSR
jgi:mono/diheme cytochrome c family protein